MISQTQQNKSSFKWWVSPWMRIFFSVAIYFFVWKGNKLQGTKFGEEGGDKAKVSSI